MDKVTRNIIKGATVAGCLAWLGFVGWQQFGEMPKREVLTHSSQTVKDMMSDCKGTFKERYACKDAIIVQTGQDSFWNVLWRLLIVIVPPIAVTVAFTKYMPPPPLPRFPPVHRRVGKKVDPDGDGEDGDDDEPPIPPGEDPDVWLEQARKALQSSSPPPGRRRF